MAGTAGHFITLPRGEPLETDPVNINLQFRA